MSSYSHISLAGSDSALCAGACLARSPLYGAPSSNHAELALPYFDALVATLPLAKRRAGRQPWPGGSNPGQPGLPGQQVDEYTIADKGGYDGANFPCVCTSSSSSSASSCFLLWHACIYTSRD